MNDIDWNVPRTQLRADDPDGLVDQGSSVTAETPSTQGPESASANFEVDEHLVTTPRDAPRGGSRRLRWALVFADINATALGWILSVIALRGSQRWSAPDGLRFGPVVVALTVAMLVTGKLYRARTCSVRAVETAGILRACFYAGIAAWVLSARISVRDLALPRVILAQSLAFVFIVIGRMGYRSILRRARRDGRFTRSVAIVGTGDEAYELQRLLTDEPELGYRVVGVIGSADEAAERKFAVPYLGSSDDAPAILARERIGGVVIGASSLGFRELNDVVRDLLDAGIHVQISGGLLGFDSSRLRANPIGREAAFYLESAQLTGWQSWVKRLLDIVLSILSLVIFLPVIAVFAAFVKRTDGGPAFFKQTRIGRDGKPFTIWKLRTIVVDAEARLAELMRQNERSGPLFKMKHDPRMTRVGRFMDATSINELPQLFNVLRGEMSLVGPRPALAREVAKFNDRLMQRHRVKPGITGLWQVESRDDPSFADYERCDLFYVENWSVRLDLMILAQTFGEVVKRASGHRVRDDEAASATP